jgi:SPP1 gp7 family putative phage head morphogenesis protein
MATQSPEEVLAALRALFNSPEYQRFSDALAETIVTQLFTDAGRTWRQAAAQNSMGRVVRMSLAGELRGVVGGVVMEQIRRNAGIIRTLPLNISRDVTAYLQRESQKGRRAAEIAKEIQLRFPENSRANAQLITRTEVSKISTALTRARAEEIDLPWYIWRTSQDQRVRGSHKIMEGVLVRWAEPPSSELLAGEKSVGKYHAGEVFNCRCYPEPVLSLDDISWPCKVYTGGVIRMMTRAQFVKLAA